MSGVPPSAGRSPRVVLFDAGGVLLDLDHDYVRRLIELHHEPLPTAALAAAEARARVQVERMVRLGGRVGEAWRDHFRWMLAGVHVPVAVHEAIIDALWEAHQRVGLWTAAVEGAVTVVRSLRERGLSLGVVSNAEGQVARDLDRAGYEGLFDVVVDSFHAGVEKPDPRIFHVALERLGARPEEAVYIGDLPAVDVAGARAAGIAPLLLDRYGLYPETDAPRLSRITELPAALGLER
jgi:putative hydrolase of the HAD superfamily